MAKLTESIEQEENGPSTKKNKPDETVKLVDTHNPNLKDEYIFCIDDQTKQTSVESEYICSIGDGKGNEITCKIGSITLTVVLDSGSKYNIVDSKTWEFLKENKVIVSQQQTEADQEFKAYGGYPLTVLGVFFAKIETRYKTMMAKFYVLKNYGKTLIGYQTGVPLGVMKIGENVNQIEENTKLSKIKGFVVDIPLKDDIKPIAQPYRRIPVPLEKVVDKKIDDLLEQGIIEQVDSSHCASSKR